MKRNKERYLNEIKETAKLSIPLIIGQVGQMMMGVVDSMMVGKLGAAPLAASAIGNGLFMLIIIFGTGITLAISPIVAKAIGEGNNEECGVALRQGLVVSFAISLVLTPIAIYGTGIIHYLNQKPDVEVLAISYGKILGWSTIPFLLFSSYKCFTEGVSLMKPAMVIMLLANGVNVLANWMFIFGNLGFEAMGLDGAGFATLTSRMFMLIAIVAYVLKSKKLKKYDPSFHFRRFDIGMMKRILKIGVPSGTQYLFEGGAFITSAFLIGMMSKNDLAAHQIAINLASMTYMVFLGISMTASVKIAGEVGKKDTDGIKVVGYSTLILAFIAAVTSGIVFIIFNNELPLFYIEDVEVISIASTLLLLAAAFQLSDGLQAVMLGALRGLSDVKVPTRITFVAYWVIGLPLGSYLGFKTSLGVDGIWYGLILGLTASATMLIIRFLKLIK